MSGPPGPEGFNGPPPPSFGGAPGLPGPPPGMGDGR